MLTLDNILLVLGALVGWPAFVALVIDVLKWRGVVDDGTAPKWNLGFNLAGFLGVGILLGFFPQIDIAGWDAVVLNYVNIAAYIFTIIVQMFSATGFHALYKKTNIKAISFSKQYGYDDLPF
jgi:hypothetical protein